MSRLAHGEEGQATPLYITAVVGLLFLALMFFAFGQADVSRNKTQTAADAAALAAAQKSRDDLDDPLREHILARDVPWLMALFANGNVPERRSGCYGAPRFAQANGANQLSCNELWGGRWGVTVDVRAQQSMGNSIVDGTETKHAESKATAVVEFRCQFKPPEAPLPEDGDDDDQGKGNDKPKPSLGGLVCDGSDWELDPGNLDLLPGMADLFNVRLAED
ncbi:pilus assembly protein TadG-related protein [Streptomyces sp. NPDC048629]|uniref:pilus assembly protein TadG-related protein n=1 Tax=Streptomyces sp. NPDC048629 TaxID=3154824 RepID=UPI00342DEE07